MRTYSVDTGKEKQKFIKMEIGKPPFAGKFAKVDLFIPYLIRSFAGVTTNVTLQFTQLDASIVALVTLVRFFMCMPVSNMPDQFARRGEAAVTVLAHMRLGSRMCVHMVLQ